MSPVFDRAHFDHMTGGDKAVQAEVKALFLAQLDGLTAKLGEEDWRVAAHTLKGSARGIGLFELAEICEIAEASGEVEARTQIEGALARAVEALKD
jgi:HPt (histidine-containing phosphotransfer) domain-containing protein